MRSTGVVEEYRVVRAIYLVGGLFFFLEGLSQVVTQALIVYDDLVHGTAPSFGSTYWTNLSVELFLGLLFVLAGLFLLFLAWRSSRRSGESGPEVAARDVS